MSKGVYLYMCTGVNEGSTENWVRTALTPY